MFTHVKFAELPVTNQDRAVQFYTEKLGLQVAQDASYQEDWRWIALEIPGAATKILFTQRANEAEGDVPSLTTFYPQVYRGEERLGASSGKLPASWKILPTRFSGSRSCG